MRSTETTRDTKETGAETRNPFVTFVVRRLLLPAIYADFHNLRAKNPHKT
jgi:hypothetical protein